MRHAAVLLVASLEWGCGEVISSEPIADDRADTPGSGSSKAPTGGPQNSPTEGGLVAYFPFDALSPGQGSSSAIGGYLAACDGGCPTEMPGRLGGSLYFDETVVLRLADDGSFQTKGGFTIALWIYPTRLSSATPLSKTYQQPTTVLNSWQIELADDGGVSATSADADGDKHKDSIGIVAPVDTWTHIALTWDGTRLIGFGNGERRLDLARSIAFDAGALIFGGDENYGELDATYFFQGRLDELRIYNRALAEEDIARLAMP
jgi:hypothetical protein